MRMQVPAEFEVIVHIVNDQTHQNGKVTIGLGAGELPSTEKVKARIQQFEQEEMPTMAPGFRLATKREFWDVICLEKTGGTFAMPGGADWDE